jgi:hypothetical protein
VKKGGLAAEDREFLHDVYSIDKGRLDRFAEIIGSHVQARNSDLPLRLRRANLPAHQTLDLEKIDKLNAELRKQAEKEKVCVSFKINLLIKHVMSQVKT